MTDRDTTALLASAGVKQQMATVTITTPRGYSNSYSGETQARKCGLDRTMDNGSGCGCTSSWGMASELQLGLKSQ